MKIVLDTNCLLPAVFPRSIYNWIWQSFRDADFTLCYSNEIIVEYEELLSNLYRSDIVDNIMFLLLNSHNVEKVISYFRWNLIAADPDDNKFVDCAFNAGADFIVTNDKHFNVLKNIDFPKINIVDIETFKNIISAK
ncbi:MAG: putative toxin-antitoxin system toxin component, PIN family [Bacteroidales bacterium]|nr:putative toxin-antitoxin system toxin component, PIN family [Bacteroidales bacterium]MCL2133193.1 putative toxin-antitoxin system toxin component, PIN family [Bacteroidales bacterium]